MIGFEVVITSLNEGANLFSSRTWPTAFSGLNAAEWKSLGSWYNGNPTYPQLIFED